MQISGTLYVIAAASGTGKTSLVRALADTVEGVQISISHTTRPARPGERDGVEYFFTEEARFAERVNTGVFLEHAEVFGHRYGTSRAWVTERLQAGHDVVLEIDWQGAAQVRQRCPDCVGIFILPPSRDALRQRLERRRQDAAAVIQKRLAAAREEISHYAEFDYLVVNDAFDVALADLQAIVRGRRLRRPLQAARQAALLAELLKIT